MQQTKRKFGKLWWVTVTVAVLMALVFAVETPLVAFAEGTNGGKGKYIKEMAAVVLDAAMSEDPEGTAQLLEGKQGYLDELESEGPEEKQIVEEIESFDTAFEKLPIEEQNSYNNGKMYYKALSGCAYKGFNNNQYNNLLELFMKYEGTTEKISEQYQYYDFYPFFPRRTGLSKKTEKTE